MSKRKKGGNEYSFPYFSRMLDQGEAIEAVKFYSFFLQMRSLRA
jgi:hypothetical protein